MSQDRVFDIHEVTLGHDRDADAVLYIPNLQIKRGQLTFILGPSGAGKSTLLETLGAMKNCVLDNEDARLDLHTSKNESLSLMNIWEEEGVAATQLRRAHYSFIFQSTDLMPNFTLGENICFSGMLSGKSMAEVKPKVLDLMSALNLDHGLFNQPSTSASGGQRQRAAFVRALCKEYEVLFCDEPTGNLDQENAVSLFTTLQRQIKEENRSAIIVSHDTDLSERFADEILTIRPMEGTNKKAGCILSND